MKTRLSARARRKALRIDERWREFAEHKELFVDELAGMLERLEAEPSLGTLYDAGTKQRVLRVRLEKSAYFLYYAKRVDELVVLSIWSALRGRQPKL